MTKQAVAVLYLMLLLALFAVPAAAQCVPMDDPDCTPDIPPEVTFSPEGGTYTSDGTAVTVPVTIAFTDAYGLNAGSRKIRLWKNGTYQTLVFNWSASSTPTRGWATGNVVLTSAGDYSLTAEIADKHGYVGSGSVPFRLNVTDVLPIANIDPHHNDYRDTTLGAFVTSYAAPSYTSMDAPRATAFQYVSEQANATAFVQVDARPDPRNAAQVTALSLRIEDFTTNALVGREYFFQKGDGRMQRLAAQWSMAGQPTGMYKYWAVVRAYLADGTFKERRLSIRVLIVNESGSRYGAGWTLGGVQRIYNMGSGLLVYEGDGVARWFATAACSAEECPYVTPQGDFSKIVYRKTNATWVRTYNDGSSITFASQGLQTHARDRFGNTTTFEWQSTQDGKALPVIARIIDPAGHITNFSYNARWFLQSVTAPGGRSIFMAYNDGTRLTNVYGLAGTSLQITHDAYNGIVSYMPTYNNGVSAGTWNVGYDANRRLSSITAPPVIAGGVSTRPVTTFGTQQSGTVLAATSGTTLASPAPPIYAETRFISVTDPGGHTVSFGIDRYGNPLSVMDPTTYGTTTTRNVHGLPESVTTATKKTAYTWTANGLLLRAIVNNIIVYEASYDASSRLIQETSGGAKRWFEYGPAGELVRSWTGEQTDQTRTGTTYAYNSRYQVVRADGPKGERTEWSYEANPWRNADYARISRQDGTLSTMSFTYDAYGRVRTATNPQGQTSTYSYDDLDRTTAVLDAGGKTTSYTFTGPHLTKITDRSGKAYQFQYNTLGWLETETFPDLKTRTYRYDRDGLLVSRTDRRGLTVDRTYDAAHRLYNLIADGQTTTFRYPDAWRTVTTNAESEIAEQLVNGTGLTESVSTTLGGRRYELLPVYDQANAWRFLGGDLKVWSNGVLLRTQSIRQSVNFKPSDPSLSSTLSVTDFGGGTATMGFDTAGRPAWTNLPNGVTQYQSYTTDGSLTTTSYSTGAVDVKLGNTFNFDSLNRLVYRTSKPGDKLWAFGYDGLGQLFQYRHYRAATAADCPNPSSGTCPVWVPVVVDDYAYDAAGNRTDRGAVIQPNSNRYTSFNGVTLEYDAEGNVTRRVTGGTGAADIRFTYDSLGRLTTVVYNGLTIIYGYDGYGRRVRRLAGSTQQYYLYSGDNLVQELDQYGNQLRTYTYWPGVDNPLSVRVTLPGIDTTYYYATEAPGNVTGLLDNLGSVAAQYRYAPFGEVESKSEPVWAASTQPLRYMAREADPVTGLYYVRNRWYDATLARFLSEDPIGIDGGMNTYAYAGNDPVNQRDPSGLSPGWECNHHDDGTLMGVYKCVWDPTYNWGMAFGDRGDIFGSMRTSRFSGITVTRSWADMGTVRADVKPCDRMRCPELYPEPPTPPQMTIGPAPIESPFANLVKQQQCRDLRNWAAAWTGFEIAGMIGGAPGSRARYTRTAPVFMDENTFTVDQPLMGGASGGYAAEARQMYIDAGCAK